MKNFYNNVLRAHRRQIVIGIFFILTAIRFFLFLRTPLAGAADIGSDDWNLLWHSWQLGQGGWLGDYQNNPLAYGISFPFFLLVCSKLCIPYMFAVALIYTGSIVFFLYTWKTVFVSPAFRGTLYLLLLYSPVMMTVYTAQRVWDFTLVPSLVLLILAFGYRIYKNKLQDSLTDMIIFSIIFTFFWYLRQTTYWILPLFIGFIAILAYTLKKENALKKLSYFLIPVGLIIVCGLGISLLNMHYYDRFAVYTSTGKAQEATDSPADIAKNTLANIFHISVSQMVDVDTHTASGDANDLRLMESLTGSQVIYPNPNPLKISGWAFPTKDNSNLELAVTDQNGQPLAYAEFENSEDVYMENMEYAAARVCRFTLEAPVSDPDTVSLTIYLNGEQTANYPIAVTAEENDDYHILLEEAGVVQDPTLITARHTIRVSKLFLLLYKIMGIPFMILAAISYLGLTLSVKKKGGEVLRRWVLLTMIGFTALVGVLLSCIFYPLHAGYDAAAYASGPWMLIHIFMIFAISWFMAPFLKRSYIHRFRKPEVAKK
ncbi:MAG: hypothetical protein EOM18_03025 [Clostridia bacterium]|nr:hypothetical protein [Clostridia bacterium]